jgi:hypothetical protein
MVLSNTSCHAVREGAFCALALRLRQVVWPDKFNPKPIDKYGSSSNPEEFIHVYHTILEAVGGDDQVKANYLLKALTGVARSWLINLLESTIYN